jgi:hypothetical protein
MRSGGLSSIAHWAKTFEDRKEGKFIRPGERAPASHRKEQLIKESRSDVERLLEDFSEAMLDDAEEKTHAIPLTSLRKWLAESTKEKVYQSPQQLARMLRHEGLWLTERKKVGSTKEVLIVNREQMLKWDTGLLRGSMKAPTDVLTEQMKERNTK